MSNITTPRPRHKRRRKSYRITARRVRSIGPIFYRRQRRILIARAFILVAWLESRVARDTSDADARLPKSLTGQEPG
jgi:hypothetical protein